MIEVRRLSKSFGRDDGTLALNKVSFGVKAGAIFGILGHEGAGRTTLLRILATLIVPTEGKAEIAGLNVISRREEVKRIVGYAPQTLPFHQVMSISDYLAFWGMVDGLPRSERVRRVKDLIEFLDMADAATERVFDSTTYTQRRLSLAQALISEPEVLLIDEPMAALNPTEKESLRGKILDLHKEGKTILLTASMLKDVQPICSDLLILDRGKSTRSYEVAQLLRAIGQSRHARIFVEAENVSSSALSAVKDLPGVVELKQTEVALVVFVTPREDLASEIEQVLESKGAEIKTLRVAEIPLSDVFRTLVKGGGS